MYELIEWPDSKKWLEEVRGENREVFSVEYSDDIANPAVMVRVDLLSPDKEMVEKASIEE